MYCNNASKAVEGELQSPVIISHNAVVELESFTHSSQHQGITIINLEGCGAFYQDEPEKELLLK